MKKQKSIKKNFIYNTFLTMTNFIFPLITFPYVSRILMPSGTGRVSFALSLISYFTMLSQLGMPTYGIRTCSKVRNDREKLTRTVHELLCINLIMCVVSYILLALALIFVPALKEDRQLYIIVSFTILLTSIGMEWLYKALEQYRYIALRSIAFKFIALGAMFLLVHDQSDYIIYGFIAIFAASASNIFNFIHVRKYIDLKPVGGYHIRRHLKPLAVFFAMACATTIYTHMDTLMLGFMLTKKDVGYYNAAVRIKSLLLSIVTSLGAVLLPRSSFLIQTRQWGKFRKVSKKALDFVFILSSAFMRKGKNCSLLRNSGIGGQSYHQYASHSSDEIHRRCDSHRGGGICRACRAVYGYEKGNVKCVPGGFLLENRTWSDRWSALLLLGHVPPSQQLPHAGVDLGSFLRRVRGCAVCDEGMVASGAAGTVL